MYFSKTLKSLSIVTFFAFMTIIMVLIIIIINVITDSYGVRNSFNIMDSYDCHSWLAGGLLNLSFFIMACHNDRQTLTNVGTHSRNGTLGQSGQN